MGFLSWHLHSPLFDLLSADQLPLLTHSCCSFSFGLLRPSRPQTGRHRFLVLGQLVVHQHPGSTHQSGLLGQDCLTVSVLSTFLPSIFIFIFGATWPSICCSVGLWYVSG